MKFDLKCQKCIRCIKQDDYTYFCDHIAHFDVRIKNHPPCGGIYFVEVSRDYDKIMELIK